MAAEQIPLVYNALNLAKQNINAKNVTEEALQNAKPVLEQCEKSAASIKNIFDKTILAKDASRAERLRKAVFQDAEALEDIKAAIEQLTNAPDEEAQPQFVHSGTGAINANIGGGTQENYTNSGSGTQYNSEKQYFGRDQGTGKSTIARTIAQEYTNPQWQLGSFFFSKGGGDAGHIDKFVGTIAMQLSYRWPAFNSALQKAIAADGGIVRKTQKAQWAALILEPLSDVLANSSPQRVLFVIDAIDECGTGDDMSHIVELLLDARGVNQTALRIFVTSRPEIAIRNEFDYDLGQRHLILVLHQIDEVIVQKDLYIFLYFHLTKIRQSRGLGAEWPGDTNIHRLVAMSGNLFIWAATVCRFVSKGGRLVKNRLFAILENGCGSIGPEAALDRIYRMVLENAIGSDLNDKEKAEVTNYFRYTLGTIAVLFAPLSVADLGHLLGDKSEEVKLILADFHSILDVPDDTDRPIRLHHPSFRDFLYDPSRCYVESLYVDKIAIHSIIADRCINVMFVLQKDICGLKDPGTIVEDIESAVVALHLPGALQYSCRYWLDHSEHGQVSLNDDGPVHRFLREYCPYWLEAMSLIGRVIEAINMMIKLESLIDEEKAPKLQTLVGDILRFIHTFNYVLNKAPLQLYNVGLHFSPFHSIFRKLFSVNASRDIKVMTQIPDEWNACIQTLEGHSQEVNSVVFSPDGSRVASGSEDRTARVWDVQTGECQYTLEGHLDAVRSVVFSPDGSRVASGSEDQTARVWDVQTGECQYTLEGHLDAVRSAVFSPDGSRVASGSEDQTVRVWDVQTGKYQYTLEGHSDTVRSVIFSPDGSRVASGSWDQTVRVWDVQTGKYQHTLEGHTHAVCSVVFSPDGSRVASGSTDQTVRVWDVQTGKCQYTLEGHSHGVNNVVFSPDGSRVASSSRDHTVRVWDIASSTEIFCCDVRSYDAVIEFSDDSSQVVVNGNLLSLPPQTPLLTTIAGSRGLSSNVPVSKLGFSDDWLTLSDKMILWLPPEISPRKVGELRQYDCHW